MRYVIHTARVKAKAKGRKDCVFGEGNCLALAVTGSQLTSLWPSYPRTHPATTRV
jgi:hypothetical protein